MKISLNWLRKYVDIKVDDDELIRLIGARLVEVESVIDDTHKYDNIYIVRVENAERIPDTHLTLCQINDGSGELIQVLCGAPNVHEGMLAAWIKPGATVPATYHDEAPFIIGKRKMLNQYDSNGMLAAMDELDLGDDHEGIIEINPEDAKPGDLLADKFELSDKILEIENKSLTHRPDCFGIIGFAREVAGILGQPFATPEFLYHEEVFPEGFLKQTNDGIASVDCRLKIEITDASICPRYTGAVLKVIDPTAEEKYLSMMKVWLAKSGMKSISKIVDVTNYLMLLTGQPLHAFDYDKFMAVGGSENPKIIVRTANQGEKIVLLDGEEIECVPSDILITSNGVPVAMAGAMGGKNTEIDESTNNVLLESASFSLYNLRKTQMAHGIFSEAITRFTKGVPAGDTFNVLAEAVREVNGKPLEVCDVFPGIKPVDVVKITTDEINDLLGTSYKNELIVETLKNVGFDVQKNGNSLTITTPLWRTDIHIKEDIIEEVGRLLGYDNIVSTLPLHATSSVNPMFDLKRQIRDLMSKYGANELLTYSFVSDKLLQNAGLDLKNSYKIVNSISPELQFVRQSIVPSLLDKAFLNEKLPVEQFAIYEMNKVYQKEWGLNAENVPVEKNQLGFVVAERKNGETAYYKAKKYVDKLLRCFGLNVIYVPLKSNAALARPFEVRRAAEIRLKDEDVLIGVVGEFKNSVKQNFKLADYLAGFEIDLDLLLEHMSHKHEVSFEKLEKRDLTVKTLGSYQNVVEKVERIINESGLEATITPGTIYRPDGADEKHVTLHLAFKKFDESVMNKLENL